MPHFYPAPPHIVKHQMTLWCTGALWAKIFSAQPFAVSQKFTTFAVD